MRRENSLTLCFCGRQAAGIDADTRSPSCRRCAATTTTDAQPDRRLIADGGDPDPEVGITHEMDELPPGFADLTDRQQQVMAGGFSRKNLIELIRKRIGSETSSKTDRLLKSELIDLLIKLEDAE